MSQQGNASPRQDMVQGMCALGRRCRWGGGGQPRTRWCRALSLLNQCYQPDKDLVKAGAPGGVVVHAGGKQLLQARHLLLSRSMTLSCQWSSVPSHVTPNLTVHACWCTRLGVWRRVGLSQQDTMTGGVLHTRPLKCEGQLAVARAANAPPSAAGHRVGASAGNARQT